MPRLILDLLPEKLDLALLLRIKESVENLLELPNLVSLSPYLELMFRSNFGLAITDYFESVCLS